MPLLVTIPDKIVRDAAVVAEARGTSVEQVILQILRDGFLVDQTNETLTPDDALAEEISEWNAVSDADFARHSANDHQG